MKKILFFVPLVLAVLAGCEKEVVEDDPIRMDPDHLTYVEEGVRLIAGAEQSRVSFELQPGVDEGTYVASKMAWEVGDIINVCYNGRIRKFVTNTAGALGNFNPCTSADVITRGEFDGSKTLIAYYNISSDDIDKETGNASFTIAPNQTEGDATNKIPLYAYIPKAKVEYDQVLITFKPMASVVDFSVSAGAAAGKDGSDNQLVSYPEDFSYQLTKVVLTPNSGAGWTTGSCTFNPSSGAVSTVTTSLSAITFNFANATDIAIAGGRHFQMIVGQCRLNNTGATMDWYKGEAKNYTKSIWADKDINLTGSTPKFLFQGLKPKAVGLYDYDDYYTKFYTNRNSQANFINYCDDERNIILTGDINLLPTEDPSDFRNVSFNGLTWNFDGKGHKIYNFYSTDAKRLVALFSALQADIRNVQFGNPEGAHNSIDISDNGLGGTYAIINSMLSGTVENLTSYLHWKVTASSATASCYLGGFVGNLNGGTVRNCNNYGSVTLIKGEGNTTGTYIVAGIVANVGGSISVENCTNEAPVSLSGDFSGAIYCGGILGGLGLKCTVSDCKNYATVNVENTNNTDQSYGESSAYIRTAGIIARVGSTGDPDMAGTISGCINYGDVSGVIAAPVKTYSIAGLVADFQQGHTMRNCVQRGNLSATQAGVYNNASVGWLSVWCASTVESASVLKGITMNNITVSESNYHDRNIWSRNNNPGTLTLITE